MINVYGIFQKFCDQGISADKWIKRTNNDKATPRFSMKDMMDTWFHAKHVGIKSFYYTNSQNSGDRSEGKEKIKEVEGGCTGGSCEV